MHRGTIGTISKRRVVGVIITLVSGAIAAYFAIDALSRARLFDEWLVAEPAHFLADLSRAGTFEAPFTQTCQISHGESILLNLPDASGQTASLLAGLKGRVQVLGADGNSVVDVDIPHQDDIESSKPEEGIQLAYFHPFASGSYTLRMQIVEPAPALAGRVQVIVARYRLCGLERMPALVATGFSAAAGASALLVGAFTIVGLKRHGWRHRSTQGR